MTTAGSETVVPRPGRVPELDLPFLEAGAGPPVLLLHGWAAFKEIWWGTLLALAPRYRGVALEWPGHSHTPAVADVRGIADLASLAARSCAQLGLSDITVVGHSLGGRVAAQLALDYPELVARLVLVDAALDPQHIAGYGRRMLQLKAIERSVRMSRRLGRGLGRLLQPAANGHGGGLIRPYLRRAYYNGLADPETLHSFITSLYADSLEARLPLIGQPTLVVSGARDPLVLPRQARRAAELIPDARLELIPGALHNPMDDRPAAFYRVLLGWLDETGALPAAQA
jgi:pimeloyl-ACP methyl ester carboxylesterase